MRISDWSSDVCSSDLPGSDDEGRAMQGKPDPAKLMADFFAGYEYLAGHPDGIGKADAVGFCYGGGVCNALAVAYSGLAASVPFYGPQPLAPAVPASENRESVWSGSCVVSTSKYGGG